MLDCVLTVGVNHEVKHGVISSFRNIGQVQRKLFRFSQEGFQLGPVVQLEEGANRPHDHKDVEARVVLAGHRMILVFLVGDETLEQIAGLEEGSHG